MSIFEKNAEVPLMSFYRMLNSAETTDEQKKMATSILMDLVSSSLSNKLAAIVDSKDARSGATPNPNTSVPLVWKRKSSSGTTTEPYVVVESYSSKVSLMPYESELKELPSLVKQSLMNKLDSYSSEIFNKSFFGLMQTPKSTASNQRDDWLNTFHRIC